MNGASDRLTIFRRLLLLLCTFLLSELWELVEELTGVDALRNAKAKIKVKRGKQTTAEVVALNHFKRTHRLISHGPCHSTNSIDHQGEELGHDHKFHKGCNPLYVAPIPSLALKKALGKVYWIKRAALSSSLVGWYGAMPWKKEKVEGWRYNYILWVNWKTILTLTLTLKNIIIVRVIPQVFVHERKLVRLR